MKKKECAVVQDLLVLYEDNLLQAESREVVEEHVKSCSACREIYDAMKSQIVIKESLSDEIINDQDTGIVKAMKKFARRVTLKYVLGIAIILTVIMVADMVCQAFTVHGGGIRAVMMSVPAEDVTIKEMYQLQSGDIYIVFQSEEEFSLKYMSNMNVPHEEMRTDSENGYYNVHFEKISEINKTLTGTVGFYEVGIVYPIEDYYQEDDDGNIVTRKCSQINYVENFEDDTKILWKKGQKIEKASLELEKELIKEYIERDFAGKAWEAIASLDLDDESREIAESYYKEKFDTDISGDVFAGTYAPMIVYEKIGTVE